MARYSNPIIQYSSGAGVPLPGATLDFFQPGTTTPKDTFSDSGLTTANPNPVVADSSGVMPNIFLDGTYKVVLKDSDGVIQPEGTKDPVGDTTEGQWEAWLNDNTYNIPDLVKGSDNRFYRSLTNANQGNDPTSSAANWEEIEFERIFNVNVTYALGDRSIGSDGMLYFSQIASNTGNDPTTDGVNWTPAIQARFSRNFVINGALQVNQRVVSGTVVLASGDYGHDRFRGGSSGCTYTFAISSGLTTITISAGTLEQVIEGDNVESQAVILSWEGTAQGQINGGGFGDSGVSATAFGGSNATIEFDTGTLAKVQLEAATIATLFEQISIAEDLSLCQRYFEKSYDTSVAPGTITAVGDISETNTRNNAAATIGVRWAVEKRAIPTVLLFSPATGNSGVIENSGDKTASANSAGTRGIRIINITGGTGTAVANYHYTADAEL